MVMKAQEILENGTIVDSWSCDTNEEGQLESNAGVENIVEFEGKTYSVITDFSKETVYEFEGNGKECEYEV